MFGMLILNILTSCSPLIKKYDSADTKEMHKRMVSAEKRARAIKSEYERIYRLWRECDSVVQEQSEALDECRRTK